MSTDADKPQEENPSNNPEPARPETEQASQQDKDTNQYTNTFQQANIVAEGDNTYIVNSGLGYADIKQIIKDTLQFHDTMSERSSPSDIQNMIKQAIADELQSQRQSAAYMNDTSSQSAKGNVGLPTTREGIETWFYELNEDKQYTVQAVAILHGGRVQEIDQLREELYQSVREERAKHESTELTSTTTSLPVAHHSDTEQPQSSYQFYEKTYTEFRLVNGVERIFWIDADESGSSQFSLKLLGFLAQEAARGSWGQRGQNFLNAAQRWAETSKGDAYWRAARAAGVIWCSMDYERLQRLANIWANGNYQRSWRRAASLLAGAYDQYIERTSNTDQDQQKSRVFMILDQWVARSHAYSNIRVGCAAAYTYGLMSRRYPQLALQRLDMLLQFPLHQKANTEEGIPVSIFAAIVSNYINLIWMGHLRLLLQHIARRVEELSHHRRKLQKAAAAATYRFQRTITLEAMFNVFFIAAGTSLPDTIDEGASLPSLTAPLAEPPMVPDEDGRDTILVGLLMQDKDYWRTEIVKILCGAIIENKSKLAFLFLRQFMPSLCHILRSRLVLSKNGAISLSCFHYY